MVQTNLNLPIAEIKMICQKYNARELALFGSILRDDFKPTSDVDLLVEFDPDAKVGFIAFSKMQRELSSLLHRQVDLVPKGRLKPRIRQSILANTQVIYATSGYYYNETWHDYETSRPVKGLLIFAKNAEFVKQDGASDSIVQ